jgi:hypothetical protein
MRAAGAHDTSSGGRSQTATAAAHWSLHAAADRIHRVIRELPDDDNTQMDAAFPVDSADSV